MTHSRQPGEDDLAPFDLTSLDADFAVAPLPQRSLIPDGRYHVQIAHVELTTTHTSGRPLLKWRLRICGPAWLGRCLSKTSRLSNFTDLRWLKHDLQLCGLHIVKLSDLPPLLDRLLHVELEVTKQTRGDWENVHFNRRLPADPDSTVPF
jgi:hypothetical protein